MKILQTKNGKSYDLTDEEAGKIMAASIDGVVPGVWVQKDYVNFFEIQSITKRVDRFEYPQLSVGAGFTGVISNAKRLSSIRAIAAGIKNVIDERKADGFKSPKAEKLLQFARKRYKLAKTT